MVSTINLVIKRGIKKLAYGKYLSVSRFRHRKGLPEPTMASNPLVDEPDWCYPDGRPGLMNKGQSLRYLRDQEMGQKMVDYMKMFKAVNK